MPNGPAGWAYGLNPPDASLGITASDTQVRTALTNQIEQGFKKGQLAVYLRHPVNQLTELLRVLPHHWPNPIEATMTLKGSFNGLPRWPFQIGHVFSRTAALLAQLSRGSAASSYEELMRS